jgi:DNA modification methylase
VLDPFGGSGSTLIACAKAARQARLLELDPKYFDVIVRRWQAWTGEVATLEGDGRRFEEIAAAQEAAAA